MKQSFIGMAIVAGALVLSGCETPSGQPDRTASGALAGGVIGAGSGAIIGSATHNAGAGALTGGIIGNAMDQQQREILARQSPATLQRVDQGQPLGLADIKALAKAGVSDEVIISQIRSSYTVYHLSTAEILDLKDAGVNEKVIDFMINTPSLVPAASAARPAEGMVVADAPPPPIAEEVAVAPGLGYVWIGGCWTWYRGHWVWARGYWAWPPYRHAYWVPGGWVHRGPGWTWVPGHWRRF